MWVFFSSAGHPPPGDFIALGSKGQANESKTTSTLLKPAPSGLPSERKRDASASLSGSSALTGLTKRPKLSSTPPLSALGRLAEAAVAEKRAISPSIKEPSVVPIEGKVRLLTFPERFLHPVHQPSACRSHFQPGSVNTAGSWLPVGLLPGIVNRYTSRSQCSWLIIPSLIGHVYGLPLVVTALF